MGRCWHCVGRGSNWVGLGTGDELELGKSSTEGRANTGKIHQKERH